MPHHVFVAGGTGYLGHAVESPVSGIRVVEVPDIRG
jgi:hypothetical protein